MGLRFSLHPLVLAICNRLEISPSQLWPLSHGMVAGFILCAKLYGIAATADCFFSLIYVDKLHADIISFLERPGFVFLSVVENISFWDDEWMGEFFFLRPFGKSWNCFSEWRKTPCNTPTVDAAAALYQDLALKSGLLQSGGFHITELMQKDLLIHGGIEQPGLASPQFTFQYLMHRAEASHEFEPQDIPNNLTYPSASDVPIHDNSSSSSQDIVPPQEEVLREGQEEGAAPHDQNKNCEVAISETLDSVMLALKECCEKLEKEKQQVTSQLMLKESVVQELKRENELNKAKISELELTRSSVQKLKQENELYKAKIIDSEHRTIQANVKVKVLGERLENHKPDSDRLHDKIIKHGIEEFKFSDEFANAVQEGAAEYCIKGFETCKQQFLYSGKLPRRFNLDFLDVADAEGGSSSGQVDKKSLKRKNT